MIHVTAWLFLSFVGTGLGLVTTYMSSQKHPWGVEPPQNPRQVMGGGDAGGDGVRHCSFQTRNRQCWVHPACYLIQSNALFFSQMYQLDGIGATIVELSAPVLLLSLFFFSLGERERERGEGGGRKKKPEARMRGCYSMIRVHFYLLSLFSTTHTSSQKQPWGEAPPQEPRQVNSGGGGGGEGKHCTHFLF